MSGFSAGQCEKLDILLLSSEIACPASSTAKVLVLEEGSRAGCMVSGFGT